MIAHAVRVGALATLLTVVRVTPDDICFRGKLIARTDPRSMCEDCGYVDSLLELLTHEPRGKLVRVDFDPRTSSSVQHAVLLTIALAGDHALVRYNIFAK